MLKILSLVVSFFLGRYEMTFKKSTLILIDQFITKSRKLFVFTTLLSITSLLFVAGLLMSIYQMTTQYDSRGYIAMNSGLLTGLILAAVCLLALIGLLSATAWETRFKQQVVPAQPEQKHKSHNEQPNAFEQALTILVSEFVKDREQQRQEKAQASTHASEARARSQAQAQTETVRADRTANPSHEVIN